MTAIHSVPAFTELGRLMIGAIAVRSSRRPGQARYDSDTTLAGPALVLAGLAMAC